MDTTEKHVVVAPRAATRERLPADWEERLRRIPGVSVLGSGFGRMQIRATEQALQQATAEFGHLLHFEEAMPRSF